MISVTQKDINSGVPMSINSCPIAIAIKRQTSIRSLIVRLDGLTYWDIDNKLQTFNFNKDTISFIRKFDTNKKVKPFSFEFI